MGALTGAVVAVDPGTVHTGVVHMDARRVLGVETIAHPRPVKGDNALLDERCEAVWRRLRAFLADHPHDLVVIEGYQQQGGRGRMAMSHQTPWLVGSLTAHMHGAGELFEIQLSSRVLNPSARGNVAWCLDTLKERRETYGGQELLTNEHLRSAFAHGLYWMQGHGGA